MTNTYDTSALPLGTTSPKALNNNASNFDEAMNSMGPAFIDRFNKRRETWKGMENAFQSFLVASGFVFLADYAAGVTFTARNQYVLRLGVPYRVASSTTLPFVLTGVFATDQPSLVAFDADAIFQQDLANTADPLKGGALIGRGIQVVDSLAALRLLSFSSASITAFAAAYSPGGAFGGGHYRYDSTDTTSADNDGTILVSSVDGGRWKLVGIANAWTFGCDPSGATPCQDARDRYTAWVKSQGGGECHYPAGTYDMRTEWTQNPIVGIGFHNMIISGAGKGATTFDFTNAAPGSDGIAWVGWGGRFGMRGFSLLNAPGVGVNFNKGEVRGGPSQISRCFMDSVVVDGCGDDGVLCLQTYMCAFRGVECRNNATWGFNLQGFQTSMYFENCWAGGDAPFPVGGNGGGWLINGAVYSSFVSCGGDQNAGPGWVISNVAGVSLINCGAESNGEEGFLIRTSNVDTSGIDASAIGINNLILDGCFAAINSRSAANTFANAIGVSTANGIRADLLVRGFRDKADANSNISVVLNGTSGAVVLTEEGNKWANAFYTRSGTTSVQNETVVGKALMATLSVDQSISNAADTPVAFDTVYQNRLEASLIGNAVVIPNGVNRVKVAAGIYWSSNSVGSRNMRITKNGAGTIGTPQLKSMGNGFTGQALSSAILEVAAGDTLAVFVEQDSGGGLLAVNNGATFLSVEAMG